MDELEYYYFATPNKPMDLNNGESTAFVNTHTHTHTHSHALRQGWNLPKSQKGQKMN